MTDLYDEIDYLGTPKSNRPMTDLREHLAEIEHTQWAHWTRYMLDNLTPENIDRWRRQVGTPYPDLTEAEKESDRFWADKIIAALEGADQ